MSDYLGDKVLAFRKSGKLPTEQLKCPGVGRDAEHDKALCFYFNRPVSDDEMRALHEVMQRAVAITLTGSKP